MCIIPAKKKQKSVLLRACDQMLCEGTLGFLFFLGGGGGIIFSDRSVAFQEKNVTRNRNKNNCGLMLSRKSSIK